MSEDEKLMMKLLYFAVEDYYGDWATPQFKQTIRAVCNRLGISYNTSGKRIMANIARKEAKVE